MMLPSLAWAQTPSIVITKLGGGTTTGDGTTCVAPCAVHFDATGTTASSFTRPFHSLRYQWDFGDPSSGNWDQGAVTHAGGTWPRNFDIGPIAGHVYETPGTYTVTLEVVEGTGTPVTTTHTVTVADPETTFAAADIWCTTTGTDFANWCPHDTDGDAACEVQVGNCIGSNSDFDDFLINNAECNADAEANWCIYKDGDTFTQDALVGLFNAAAPALITARTTSDTLGDTTVTISGNTSFLTLHSRWMVAGFTVNGNAGCTTNCELFNAVPLAADASSVYKITATNINGSCYAHTGAAGDIQEASAMVDVDCTIDPSNSSSRGGIFLNGRNNIILGNHINNNETAEFNLRYSSLAGTTEGLREDYVISHNRLQKPNSGRNPMQIRGYHDDGVIVDNVMSWNDNNAGQCVRTCEEFSCNPADTDLSDLIFEANFCFIESGFSPTVQRIYHLQGSDITVRNNVADIQGYTTSLAVDFCIATAGFGTNNDIHCLNNTLYFDDSGSNTITMLNNAGGWSGTISESNLFWGTAHTGTFNCGTGSPSPSCDANVDAIDTPFDGDQDGTEDEPPEQALTDLFDFRLGNEIEEQNAGHDPTADTDHWVYFDMLYQCRSDTGNLADWDVGAHERGAAACAPISELSTVRGGIVTGGSFP